MGEAVGVADRIARGCAAAERRAAAAAAAVAAAACGGTSTPAASAMPRIGIALVVLTHFSQRYPKIPIFGDSNELNVTNDASFVDPLLDKTLFQLPFVLACDFMSITLTDLQWLHRTTPAVCAIYDETEGEASDDIVADDI